MDHWETWVNSYLQNPTDDHVIEGPIGIIDSMMKNPDANTGSFLAVSAFVAMVWNRWPERAPDFLEGTLEIVKPGRRRSVIYLMAALCPAVAPLLDALEAIDDEDALEIAGAKEMREFFGGGSALDEFEITQPQHLDLLWGAFMGSGDAKYVHAVLKCAHWAGAKHGKAKKAIGGAAVWSLSTNRVHNPFVAAAMDSLFALDPKLEDTYERSYAVWM